MTHQRLQRRGAGGGWGTPQAATRLCKEWGPRARAAVRQAPGLSREGLPSCPATHSTGGFQSPGLGPRSRGTSLWLPHVRSPISRLTVELQAATRCPGRRVGVQINGGEKEAWRWPRAHVFSGFLTKVPRQFNRERSLFSTNDARTIGCQYGKKKVTSYTRITLRGLMELKIKAYIVKLIDRNIGECLRHHVVLKGVLERTHLS